MKKIRIAVLAFLALALASCSASSPDEKAKRSLCFPLEITAEYDGACLVMKADANGFSAEFTSPRELCGLQAVVDENGGRIISDGFVKPYGADGFPAADMLYKALKAVNEGVALKESEGECEYSIDETAITVYYDPESGIVTNIITEDAVRRCDYRVKTAFGNERTGNGDDPDRKDPPQL